MRVNKFLEVGAALAPLRLLVVGWMVAIVVGLLAVLLHLSCPEFGGYLLPLPILGQLLLLRLFQLFDVRIKRFL